MTHRLTQDEIRQLKQTFNVFDAYRTLGLPGEPKKLMKSPFREDSNPSFSIYNNGNNWKDFGTGETGDVIAFIEKVENLQPNKAFSRFLELAGHTSQIPHTQTKNPSNKSEVPKSNLGPPTQIYPYQNPDGTLEYQILRYDSKKGGKTFLCRRPDSNRIDSWIYNLEGCQPVPYRLPEVLKAVQDGDLIAIVEGEKDVETLRRNGFVATCNHGGAGSWKPEFSQFFKGAKVVVIPDNDERGFDHSREVICSLQPVVADIKLLELPNLPPKGDVSDWLLCHSAADLQIWIDSLFSERNYSLDTVELFKKLDTIQHFLEQVLARLPKTKE